MGTMHSGDEATRHASEESGRDPRPDATPAGLRGGRCVVCGHPMLYLPPLCPACGGSPVEPAIFGPTGTAWSSTVLRIRVADRKPPAVLAYVDFDEGPRALVHVDSPTDEPLRPGARVRLLGRDDRGDPLVAPVDVDTRRRRPGTSPAGASGASPVGRADMSAPVSVWGVGTSRFARQPDTPPTHLAWQAVTEALDDAGVAPAAIEAVYAGTVFGDPGVTTRTLQHLGITGVPVVTVENACASGTTAFHEARTAVGQGRYETVLAFGIETMTAVFDGPIEPLATDPEGAQGFAMPSLYGMAAQRYQHVHGVAPEQMALVAQKNRRHALRNPRAQHSGEFTVEEILGSRPISDPLTLLQCCDISDAAAAAIVGPARAGGSGGATDVTIRSTALASGQAWDHTTDLVWGWQLVADTARAAFEQAGIGAADIDVLEVHDAFTIGEIVTTEALGLCELGDGGALVASGRTSLGGAQPVNPSGGLLARGHPLGATGLGQIAEIVWQLRGTAAGRQVDGARIGVVETMGGGTAGIDGNGCVVAVLEAPGVQR